MTAPSLLPCPFCGSSNIRDKQYIRDGRAVCCSDCGVSVCAFNPAANSIAITKWNTRAENQAAALCEVLNMSIDVMLGSALRMQERGLGVNEITYVCDKARAAIAGYEGDK